MADISIQFHALPEELFFFVEEVIRDFRVNLVAMQLRPFKLKEVSATNIQNFFAKEPTFRRLAFLVGEPVLPSVHELDFANKNPDHLRLDVGMKTDRGLCQSWLSARTENHDAMAVWKKIAAHIKKTTKQGVTAVNPKTGATSNMKSFRYTAEAKALAEQGVPMLPIAGASLLRFD